MYRQNRKIEERTRRRRRERSRSEERVEENVVGTGSAHLKNQQEGNEGKSTPATQRETETGNESRHLKNRAKEKERTHL